MHIYVFIKTETTVERKTNGEASKSFKKTRERGKREKTTEPSRISSIHLATMSFSYHLSILKNICICIYARYRYVTEEKQVISLHCAWSEREKNQEIAFPMPFKANTKENNNNNQQIFRLMECENQKQMKNY